VNQAFRIFKAIDKEFQPTSTWWAQELGITRRTVWRWRAGKNSPRTKRSEALLGLMKKIQNGETTPPCRIQASAQIGASGYHGVFPNKIVNLWCARLSLGGRKSISIYMPTPEHAAHEYNRIAREARGRCANKNNPPELPALRCHKCQKESGFVFRVFTRLSHFQPWNGKADLCQKCLSRRHKSQWTYDRDFYKKEFPKLINGSGDNHA